jgi:hypothetical protein
MSWCRERSRSAWQTATTGWNWHDGDLGRWFGEMSVITEKPRMASLIAVGDVRTLSIDRAKFERILAERPEVSLAVMRQPVRSARAAVA